MVFEWDLYISYMIDVYIGFYLFDKVFKVKYEKKRTLFLLIVIRVVSSFVMIAVYKNIALQTILTLIEQYILMLIFYKGKPIKKLLYLMYYASVFWISKILWIWIVPVMFLGFELSNLVEFSGLRILMILGVNIVAFLILNSTIKWFNKKTLNDKNFKISLLTLYIYSIFNSCIYNGCINK